MEAASRKWKVESSMKEIKLNIEFHEKQQEIFFKSNERFKIIAKGRRFGLTKGMANYNILRAVEKPITLLWVDTIYSNIERYYERYFLPVLKTLGSNFYHYSKRTQQLYIGKSVIDFRSADRPENLEGYGYNLITINEAGIILKNRRIWTESILPMTIDHKAEVLIGGTPKGKFLKKNEKHLFYELYQKGEITRNKTQITMDESQTAGGGSNVNPPMAEKGSNEQGSSLSFRQINWKSFNYSSYDNPLLDVEDIKEVEKEIPLFLREQEIRGKFVEQNASELIKREWWKFYTVESEKWKVESKRIVQSWDTAFKTKEENDFSVCTTWGISKSHFYLLDVFRERLEFPELKRKVVQLAEKYNVNEILIEDKASGQSLIQELERETRLPVKKIKVDRDKYSRLVAITPLIEAGKIVLPEGAHWVEQFINEFEEFPNGEFDDQVDSTTQAINANKSVAPVDYNIRTVNLKNIIRNSEFRIRN